MGMGSEAWRGLGLERLAAGQSKGAWAKEGAVQAVLGNMEGKKECCSKMDGSAEVRVEGAGFGAGGSKARCPRQPRIARAGLEVLWFFCRYTPGYYKQPEQAGTS